MVSSCNAQNLVLKESAEVVAEHYPIGGVKKHDGGGGKRDERREPSRKLGRKLMRLRWVHNLTLCM